MTIKTVKQEVIEINEDTDFVLVDFREPDEFRGFHIKEAVNMPASYVHRENAIPEVRDLKNKENSIIICYHNTEKKGAQYVTSMTEKGYDNVFFLSGGLDEFVDTYPQCCVGPQVPVKPLGSEIRSNTSNFQKRPVMRQPEPKSYQVGNAGGGGMLPSIGSKKQPSQVFSVKGRKTNSAMGSMRNAAEKFNDIPDTDSYISNNLVPMNRIPKPESKRNLITEKPGNIMFNKDNEGTMFQERRLNKIEKP